MSNGEIYNKAQLAFQRSVSAFWSVIADLEATDAQTAAARAALDEAQNTFEGVVLADFHQRTLLLNGLIAALNRVVDSVQANPIGSALDELNGALGLVQSVLDNDEGG